MYRWNWTRRTLSERLGGIFGDYRLMRWVDTLVFPDSRMLDLLHVDTRSIYNRRGDKRERENMYATVRLTHMADNSLVQLSDDGRVLQHKPPPQRSFKKPRCF